MVWHIPSLPALLPSFYAETDYQPMALRVFAERVPDAGELLVDILVDGVSIMNANNYIKRSFQDNPAYIEFGTHSATAFSVNETITGGTSGATAKVSAATSSRLTLYDVSTTAFTVGETITGGTSTAPATGNAYVRGIKGSSTIVVVG